MDATAPTNSSRPIRLPDELMHKNRLQDHTQRSSINLPIYQTINEGVEHAPKFRATVLVDGAIYTSSNTFSHRKAAEQDVARLALACITKKMQSEGCRLISEDPVFCKSILGEFAAKMNLEKPTYHSIQYQGLLPVYVSSSVFKGVTYTGAPSRNKKEAEQLAARAAILSILGDSNSGTILSEIIKSKSRLYAEFDKIKDSGYAHNGVVPLGVPLGNGQNPGNFGGISLGRGKEVEGSNSLAPIAISEACSGQVTNHLVLPQPYHEFNTSKKDQNSGNSGGISNGKEVEGSSILLPIEISEVCSGQVINPLVVPQPFHEFFKTPKKIQNPGNSGGISLGEGKEVEGTNTLPPLAISVACSGEATNHPALPRPFHEFKTPKKEQNPGNSNGIPLSIGKEVVVTPTLLPIAVSEACSGLVTNHPVLYQPFHEFKTPKKALSEAIALPIAFVPPVLQQPLGATSSSNKKRNRKNKKRGNKKSRMDAKLEVAVCL